MDGGPARLGPMTAPVKGMNYEPAPSNYVPGAPLYYDTDFYNQDFVQLWGPGTPPAQPNGRADVADMASLGVNFIRVFNWNPGEPGGIPLRTHQPWLDYVVKAGRKRMYVAAVFANGNRATDAATMVVNQFNGFSAEIREQVAVWLIGNEIAPDDPFTAQTLAVIKASAAPARHPPDLRAAPEVEHRRRARQGAAEPRPVRGGGPGGPRRAPRRDSSSESIASGVAAP